MNGRASSPRTEELLAHVEWVRRLARSLVAREDSAEEVAQETWLQALRSPPADRTNVRGWLTRVAQNVARKLVRGDRRREAREAAAPSPAPLPSPQESLERAQLQRRVVDALLALDETSRAALLLRFFEGLPPRDVARVLGVPVETARTRIKRGLLLLRERLGAQHGGEERGFAATMAPLLAMRRPPAGAAAGGGAAAAAALSGILIGGALVSKSLKLAVGAAVVVTALWWPVQAWRLPRAAEAEPAKAAGAASAADDAGGLPAPAGPPPPAAARVDTVRETEAGREAATVPPRRATVEGRVVDASGRPVAGATVVADRRNAPGWDSLNFRTYLRGKIAGEAEGRSWRVTTSGADGSFRIDELDPADSIAVGAMHDPLGTGWGEPGPPAGDPPLFRVTIALAPGVVLFGVVSDLQGKPVPAATIFLDGTTERPDDGATGFRFEFQDFAVTGADGRYRSLPLPWRHVKANVHVAKGRPDLGHLETGHEPLPDGLVEVRRDLELPPLATLSGSILGPDGLPARLARTVAPRLGADARGLQSHETIAVAAFAGDPRADPGLLERLGRNVPGLVFLDGDHVYGTLRIDEDRYEVPLRNDKLRYVAVIARDRLLGAAEIPAGRTTLDVAIDPDLVPERPLVHRLRLRLRDGRDGSPLNDVAVHAIARTRMASGQSRTSILHFGPPQELTPDRELDLPLAPCTIEMRREGFVARSLAVDPGRPGAPSELAFEFFPAAAPLAVSVVDLDGAPVAGASIRVYQGTDHEPVVPADDQATDERGACTLAGLARDPLRLVAQKEGFAPAVAQVAAGDAGRSAQIELEEGYDVILRTRLENGLPAPWGLLVVVGEDGVPLYDSLHPRGGPSRLAERTIRLVDGTYTVRCIVPAVGGGSATFVAAPGATVTVEIARDR